MRRDRNDERRRLSQEEGRRVRDYLTRQIRDSTIRGLKAQGRAATLTYEIERRQRAERRREVLDTMDSKKASLLDQIAGCDYCRRREWHEKLAGIELGGSSAEGEVEALREEIESGRRFCASLADDARTYDEASETLWSSSGPGTPFLQLPQLSRRMFLRPVGPVERLVQRQRELDRQFREHYEQQARSLEHISSTLGALLGYVREYQTLR